MKLAKLTPIQRRALRKLIKTHDWCCAYELQESLATLDALVKKKYAKYRRPLGSLFSPRTAIEYKATVREA